MADAVSTGAAFARRLVGPMVIGLPKDRVNRSRRLTKILVKQTVPSVVAVKPGQAFRFDSSQPLNCCSNFIDHDRPNKPATAGGTTGVEGSDGSLTRDRGGR
jgi:hypothetical protein